MATQDFYFSTEAKDSNDKFYNFNVPLDINIDVKKDEKLKFKLIDFSMMNSMLNVSQAHLNNFFIIVLFGVSYTITIPDGSYTAVSLRDWINAYLTANNYPLAFNYDKNTNRFWLLTSIGVGANDLTFFPANCASLFGFTNKSSYQIIYPNSYYSDTFVNMLPYSKILLTTNLAFDTNTQFSFKIPYRNGNTGIGDIIAWIPRDVPPFSTINYVNLTNREIELSNKNIKSINFSIMNEYQEYI